MGKCSFCCPCSVRIGSFLCVFSSVVTLATCNMYTSCWFSGLNLGAVGQRTLQHHMHWTLAESILGPVLRGTLDKSLSIKAEKAQPCSYLRVSVAEDSCFLWVLLIYQVRVQHLPSSDFFWRALGACGWAWRLGPDKVMSLFHIHEDRSPQYLMWVPPCFKGWGVSYAALCIITTKLCLCSLSSENNRVAALCVWISKYLQWVVVNRGSMSLPRGFTCCILRSWGLWEGVDHPLVSRRPFPWREMGQLSGDRAGSHPHCTHTFVPIIWGWGGACLFSGQFSSMEMHSEALCSPFNGFLSQLTCV